MKTTAIVLLIAFVGVLSLFLYSQTSVLREQRRQVQELDAKLESMSKTASLDLQGKCAKQAEEVFKMYGGLKEPLSSFENHYNTKLNRCFMQETFISGSGVSADVNDAFEGKRYGTFTSLYTKQGERVMNCSVKTPSGEQKECTSKDEFDALVNQYYME